MRRCWCGRCRRARFSACWPSTGAGSCASRISLSATRSGWVGRRSGRHCSRVMLLQHRTGASDEQAMEAVAWDLRWKVALGLAVDHQGWHPTSLTRFRARLLLHGKEQLALENTLRLAEEVGLLDGTAEQIIDSTPMLGAAATQDTVRLVGHRVPRGDPCRRRPDDPWSEHDAAEQAEQRRHGPPCPAQAPATQQLGARRSGQQRRSAKPRDSHREYPHDRGFQADGSRTGMPSKARALHQPGHAHAADTGCGIKTRERAPTRCAQASTPRRPATARPEARSRGRPATAPARRLAHTMRPSAARARPRLALAAWVG